MRLHVGTSGFSYDEWRGSFYPEELASDAMLGYYAERLGAVEINNTFYRMPQRSLVESWTSRVPESFRFVFKTPQRITHHRRLKDVGEDVGYFLDQLAPAGARLGALLVQCPPNLKKDLPRLESFLASLPPGDGARVAFEFRNASWHDEEVFGRLRERGAALVASDVDEEPEAAIVRTADWGYLRLRRTAYPVEALQRWAEKIRAQAWSDAFVFFKHEDAGTGPKLAAEFTRVFAAQT